MAQCYKIIFLKKIDVNFNEVLFCWSDLHQTRTSGLNHVLHSSLLLHCLVFKEHRLICLSQLVYLTSPGNFCPVLFALHRKTVSFVCCVISDLYYDTVFCCICQLLFSNFIQNGIFLPYFLINQGISSFSHHLNM